MYEIVRTARGAEPGAPAILFVGHAGLPNGFSRVLHSLLRHLPPGWDLHHFATNLIPGAPALPERNPGWKLHRNPSPVLHSPEALASAIDEVQPAIVVVLEQAWVCHRLAPALSGPRRFRSIFYAAIDQPDAVSPPVAEQLARLDCAVVFTEFAREILLSAFARWSIAPPAVRVIPHGVDNHLFFPVPRREARQLLFPDRPKLHDAFLILNANRNQPFKRIDLTMRGFAQFVAGKPDHVKLYLHMANRPAAHGERPLADVLGIRDRLLGLTSGARHPEIPSERLNLLYNACDVGINTAQREGWGLIALEHAAARVAQIVPGYGSGQELWHDAAWLLNEPVTPESVAHALEAIYSDPQLRERLALAGYRNATQSRYSWSSIARCWDQLFRELIERSPKRANSA